MKSNALWGNYKRLVANRKKAIENFRKSEQRRLNIQEFEGLVRNLNQKAKNINKQFINAYNAKLNTLKKSIIDEINKEESMGHSKANLRRLVTSTSRNTLARFGEKMRSNSAKHKELRTTIAGYRKSAMNKYPAMKRKRNERLVSRFLVNRLYRPGGSMYRKALSNFEVLRPSMSRRPSSINKNGKVRSHRS